MYNTIDGVIKMKIKTTDAQIKLLKKGGFRSVKNEGDKHIKVLPYLSVVQSVEGSYDISLGGGETLQTGEGGFFIAPPRVGQTIVHHVSEKSGKMTARWLFLDVVINRSLSVDMLYRFPTVINDVRKNELNILFERLFGTDDIWQNYSDCYALVGYLLQSATPIPSGIHRGVQDAVEYMKENYTKSMTVGDMANVANMSESNFYAVFKKNMGISPIAYLNNYRLSVAADKLCESRDTVSEISYSVGIGDPLYFVKLFKRTYGVTPKNYRLIYRREQ